MPGIERDVIYRLKVVTDPAAAGALGQVAAEAKKLTEQATASATTQDGLNQRLAASFLAEVQSMREAEAALQQKTAAMKHFGQVSADVQGATRQAAQDDQYRNQAVLSSLNKLTFGILDGARAWAIYGAASDKELERNIRTLAKLESGIRAAHAGLHGIEGAGGLIATARGGSGAEIQAASAAAGVVGVTALAGFAVVVAGLSVVSKDFREGLMELVGWTDKAGDSLKAFQDSVAKRQEADTDTAKRLGLQANFRNEVTAINASVNQSISESPQEQLARDTRDAAGRSALARAAGFQAVQAQGHEGYFATRADADKQLVDSAREQFELAQRKLTLERQADQQAIGNEQKRLGLLQDQLKATNAQIDAEKQRLISQEERLANLDPFTAQATAQAAKLANRGGQLSTEQANLLGGFTGFEGARQDAFRRQIDASGLGFILDQQKQAIANQERAAQTLTAKIDAKIESVIRMEFDAASVAKALTDDVLKARDELVRLVAQQVANQMRANAANDAARNAQKSR